MLPNFHCDRRSQEWNEARSISLGQCGLAFSTKCSTRAQKISYTHILLYKFYT
jgi:hypothetical protein